MKIKVYDVLTIDNINYVVAFILKYKEKTYYYLTNEGVKHDLKFIFIENNEFYEVQDSNLILELFGQLAKENI